MDFRTYKDFVAQGPVTLRVTGDCMCGTIAPGTEVQVTRSSIYLPGDIVAFNRSGEEVVSHRFLGYFPGRRGWSAMTRADSAASADSPVAVSRLLGKVSLIGGQAYRPGIPVRCRAVAAWSLAFFHRVFQFLFSNRTRPKKA